MKKEYIKIDMNSIASIKEAEGKKHVLENQGYVPRETICLGIDKFMTIYVFYKDCTDNYRCTNKLPKPNCERLHDYKYA